MAVSTMKRITLLAEKDYLDEVMLSLQSLQAVEVIPANVAIQNELVNEYFTNHDMDSNTEEIDEHGELFEMKSKKNEINHITSQLDDVMEYIDFLEEITPNPGFFAKLNQEKETYSLYGLHDYMEDINISSLLDQAERLRSHFNTLTKEKKELQEEREYLRRWQPLDFNPKETESFQMTRVIVGAIETERSEDLLEALKQFSEVYTESIHYSEEEILYLVIVSEMEAQDVEQTLIRQRFEKLTYKYNNLPKEELKRNKSDLDEVSNKLKRVEEEPDEAKQLLKDLKLSEEFLFNVRERKRAEEEVLTSEHLFVASGWIEEDVVDLQIQNIAERIGDDKVFTFIEDVKESEVDDVPIKLKNKKSTSAFESTVAMYSLPKYEQDDPTPIVQPFMILFFGMMTGDAGYGLLGLIVSLLALNFIDLSKSMRKNIHFFAQLMVGTILSGLFFGSFFGFELPFSVMSLSDQILEAMVLSLAIGIVHLLLGLFLSTVANNRKNDYAKSYIGGYAWMLIIIGAVVLAVNGFLGGPNLWFNIGLGLIILNLVGILVVNMLSSENKLGGLGKGAFDLMDATSYISNIISYTRLTALGVAGANVGMAFNLIVGLLPPVWRFTVGIAIFIGLHMFYMFISFISAYVHSLRLNYVEFFGKFYEGGGRAFEPIPLLEKHIIIRSSTTEQ